MPSGIDLGRVNLPVFECPDKKTDAVYLAELVWQGIEKNMTQSR